MSNIDGPGGLVKRLQKYYRGATIVEATAYITAAQDALLEAKNYIYLKGDEGDMAPVIEQIEAALEGHGVPTPVPGETWKLPQPAKESTPVTDDPEKLRTALYLFREFVVRNSTRWRLGSNHHHPIWQMVATLLPDDRKLTADEYALVRDTDIGKPMTDEQRHRWLQDWVRG